MSLDRKKEIRALVRSLAGQEDETLLWERVENDPAFQEADVILAYMALPDEVETRSFIDRWTGKKRFAIPLVDGDELRLKLYDKASLVKGYMGIEEPSEEAEDISPENISLALVPGVAFDRKCMRLGRGKGFYDRLLPDLNCIKIGIAHRWSIVESIPADPWDVPMDKIVTTTETIEL